MKYCKDCIWWVNYKDRVYARISHSCSNMARNIIELRHCEFIPHPSVQIWQDIYTDEGYVCGEFKGKVK